MSFINEHLTSSAPTKHDTCIFNVGVDCGKLKCANCGWNPAVLRERKKETREALIPPPKHWKIEL